MKNDISNDLIQRLGKEAAYATMRNNRQRCLLSGQKQLVEVDSKLICRCRRCLFARSVMRGQRLLAEEKQHSFERLKQVSATPLVLLKSIALGGLKNSITILFFSMMVSFPLMKIHQLAPGTNSPQESPSGVDISEEQIVQAITQTGDEIRLPGPPQNVQVIPAP